MSKRESIARYSLIIKKLRKKPCSFKEIADYLALKSEIQDYDYNISKRTFQRDLKDILSLYQIEIEYVFSKKAYAIVSDQQPEVTERMFEAFDTFNALNLSDRLSNHIHFEKRKPQGTEHLYGLLHAIKNTLKIKFTYHKYWENEFTERKSKPYALKEFRNRWYIIGKEDNGDHIKSFALDRLSALEILKEKFEMPDDFNVNQHYKYCFGIVGPKAEEPKNIILSFTRFQGKYIKSLPLHESQQILVDNENELRISLRVHINYDFFMELLSFGNEMKVIEPKSLVNQIVATVDKMQALYG